MGGMGTQETTTALKPLKNSHRNKPTKSPDMNFSLPGGLPIQVHGPSGPNDHVVGAWMNIGNKNDDMRDHPLLCLVSQNYNGHPMNYVEYRNGHDDCGTLAIECEADGSVKVQVVVPGNGNEAARTAEIPLADLQEMAKHWLHRNPVKPVEPQYS